MDNHDALGYEKKTDPSKSKVYSASNVEFNYLSPDFVQSFLISTTNHSKDTGYDISTLRLYQHSRVYVSVKTT